MAEDAVPQTGPASPSGACILYDSEAEVHFGGEGIVEASVRRMEEDAEKAASDAYNSIESLVAEFLETVDELGRQLGDQADDDDEDVDGQQSNYDDDENGEGRSLQDDGEESIASFSSFLYGDIDSASAGSVHGCSARKRTDLFAVIGTSAASYSRSIWSISTGTIDRILHITRNTLASTVEEIRHFNDCRYRKLRETHCKSLEAARLSCKRECANKLATESKVRAGQLIKMEREHRMHVEELTSRFERSETAQRVLTSQLDEAEGSIQALERELDSTRSDLDRTIAERDGTVQRLTEQLEHVQLEESMRSKELARTVSKLRRAESRVEVKAQQLSDARSDLRRAEGEIQSRTKELRELRAKFRGKEEECRDARRRTIDLEASLSTSSELDVARRRKRLECAGGEAAGEAVNGTAGRRRKSDTGSVSGKADVCFPNRSKCLDMSTMTISSFDEEGEMRKVGEARVKRENLDLCEKVKTLEMRVAAKDEELSDLIELISRYGRQNEGYRRLLSEQKRQSLLVMKRRMMQCRDERRVEGEDVHVLLAGVQDQEDPIVPSVSAPEDILRVSPLEDDYDSSILLQKGKKCVRQVSKADGLAMAIVGRSGCALEDTILIKSSARKAS